MLADAIKGRAKHLKAVKGGTGLPSVEVKLHQFAQMAPYPFDPFRCLDMVLKAVLENWRPNVHFVPLNPPHPTVRARDAFIMNEASRLQRICGSASYVVDFEDLKMVTFHARLVWVLALLRLAWEKDGHFFCVGYERLALPIKNNAPAKAVKEKQRLLIWLWKHYNTNPALIEEEEEFDDSDTATKDSSEKAGEDRRPEGAVKEEGVEEKEEAGTRASYLHCLAPELFISVCMFVAEGKRSLLRGPEFAAVGTGSSGFRGHPNSTDERLVARFGVDLFRRTRLYLRYASWLHDITEKKRGDFHDWIRHLRLGRYKKFLELCESSESRVVPPDDVRIIWAAHAMRPQLYQSLMATMGDNDDILYCAFVSSEGDDDDARAAVEASRKQWNEKFGSDDPYDTEWVTSTKQPESMGETDTGESGTDSEHEEFEEFREDIRQDVKFFSELRASLGTQRMRMLQEEDQFLRRQLKSYERFLYLTLKLAETKVTSYATPVIHAIWRAHQLLPRIYSSDLDRLHQSIEKSAISMIEALDRPAGANILRLPQHETGNTRELLNPPIIERAKVMEWRRLWIDEFGSSIFAETIVVAGADVGSTGRDLLNLLPRTLLKEIVDQLPTVDAIRLTCCTKTLHEEFGSGTYWCKRFCEMKGFVRIAEPVPLPVSKVPTRGNSNTRSTFDKGLAMFLSQRPSASSASSSSHASAQEESKGTGEGKDLPKTDLSQLPFSKSERVNWAFLCYQEEAIVQAMQDERVKKTMTRITASETQRLSETKNLSNTWLRSLGRG